MSKSTGSGIMEKVNILLVITVFVLSYIVVFKVGRLYQMENGRYEPVIVKIVPEWNAGYEQRARQIARSYGIDEELVLAVMWQESRFNPDCESRKGAYGLMQLMPGTAKDMGINVYSWEENLEGGVKYLKWIKSRVKSKDHMLIAYNWGLTNLKKYISGKVDKLPSETEQYVRLVNRHIEKKPWKGA